MSKSFCKPIDDAKNVVGKLPPTKLPPPNAPELKRLAPRPAKKESKRARTDD